MLDYQSHLSLIISNNQCFNVIAVSAGKSITLTFIDRVQEIIQIWDNILKAKSFNKNVKDITVKKNKDNL
jgi:hypothetical protein